MNKKSERPAIDGREFLESLKLDGIHEIYIEPVKAGPPKAAAPEVNAAPPKMPKKLSKDAEALRETVMALRDKIQACTLCSELATTRTNTVFGAGNIRADLMFIGEAPGADEDAQGLPFVGRAGKLLTKIIESIGLERRQVFIANILKCRPPQNRPPKPEEIANCTPFLMKQIELIKPKIICTLGKFSSQTLLKSEETISSLRGRFHDFGGTPLMCTYHPAYLLRSPGEKTKVWEDMQQIRDELKRLKA